MRVLVVGLGRTGSAAARALLAAGHEVVGTDQRDDDAFCDELVSLTDPRVGMEAWVGAAAYEGGAALDRGPFDVVVASPGVPPHAPPLTGAAAAGVPVWSEPELAWWLSRGRTRLVGVTGTNGKTTTTTLAAAFLRAPAAGNIGTPLVEVLAADSPPPLVVAELSSFQLHHTSTLRPDVAVLLNVADDHLDWHGGADAYAAAKARLWASQLPTDHVVAVVDDPGAVALLQRRPPPGTVVRVSTAGVPPAPSIGVAGGAVRWVTADGVTDLFDAASFPLPGVHNLADGCAAAAAALLAGATASDVRAGLAAVTPAADRIETVAEVGGVVFVNDSKATNPHAAAASLAAFDSVVWIAGGLNKGLAFDGLAPVLAGRVRAAVTIGACGPEVAAVTRRLGIPTEEAGGLAAAVPRAASLARPGDVVLLAPAAASMDQFRDYAARGAAFRELVAALDVREVGGGR